MVSRRIDSNLEGFWSVSYVKQSLLYALETLVFGAGAIHSKHGLENEVLFHGQRADENVRLLNVAADGGDHLARSYQIAVHSDLALDEEGAFVSEVERVEQRRLSCSTGPENSHELAWTRYTAHYRPRLKKRESNAHSSKLRGRRRMKTHRS